MSDTASDAQRYYDSENNRLVYVRQSASKEYWDNLWQSENLEALKKNPPKQRWLTGITRRFLPQGGRVLEGGCGLGSKVRALASANFDAVGVDYAEATVAWASEAWKPSPIVKGDVRELPFDDNSFDGYWSLGVIEHFYEGYDDILNEMRRVVRPGGYVFCTFPAMTGIRVRLAEKNAYEAWVENEEIKQDFYQFALDPTRVASDFDAKGFELKLFRGVGTLTGLAAENQVFDKVNKALAKLPLGVVSKLNVLVDPLVGRYCGHTVLLVLRKTG